MRHCIVPLWQPLEAVFSAVLPPNNVAPFGSPQPTTDVGRGLGTVPLAWGKRPVARHHKLCPQWISVAPPVPRSTVHHLAIRRHAHSFAPDRFPECEDATGRTAQPSPRLHPTTRARQPHGAGGQAVRHHYRHVRLLTISGVF